MENMEMLYCGSAERVDLMDNDLEHKDWVGTVGKDEDCQEFN